MIPNIKKIENQERVLAIIIRNNYNKEGIEFFTPKEFSQQLAFMKHPKGKVIQAHRHNIVKREVLLTQEVLLIKKGKIRVNFYDNSDTYLESEVLSEGDLILLASGGHGFEVLEELEMYEIKQGPYSGEEDKTKFQGIEK